MNREQAEKLLTALIFDDLDEASKTNLLSYLEGDEELRERLTDMRMAAKVASDTLQHGPDPVLGKERLRRLAKLAERRGAGARIFTMRCLAAAAAVVAAVVLPVSFLVPSLNRVRVYSVNRDSPPAAGVRRGAEVKTPGLYGWDVERTMDDAEASGGADFYGRRYAYDPVRRDDYSFEPPVAGVEILTDGDGFVMGESGKVGDEAFLIPGGEASGRPPGAEVLSQHYYSGDISGASSPSAAATGQPGVVESHLRAAGESVSGRIYDDLVASGAYSLRNDATVGGNVVSGTDFSNKLILSSDVDGVLGTDGLVTAYNGGDLDLVAGKPEAFVPVTGSGLNLTLEPVGGASGPSDLLDVRLQSEGGVEKGEKVAAEKTDDYASFDGLQRRGTLYSGTLSKDFGEFDLFGADADGEGEELDGKKAQSFVSGYRVTKGYGLGSDVSKEEMSLPKKAAEKQDMASTKYYGESDVSPPAVEFKLPGIRSPADEFRRREGRGGEVGYKPESTEPVKPGTSTRVPMLGDVPVLGVLYDRKAGESELGKGEAQKELADRELVPEGKAKDAEAQRVGEGRVEDLVAGVSGAEYRDHAAAPTEMFKGYDMPARGEQAGGAAGGSGQIVAGPGGVVQQGLELAGKKLAPVNAEPEEPMIAVETSTAGTLAPVAPAPESELGDPADKPSSAEGVGMVGGEDVGDLPEAARFRVVPVNPWVMTQRDSMSTFGLDVDTASYTLCRRYIRGGFLPPAGAVRMEEFINYFNYRYPQRANPVFAVHAEAGRSPFAGEGRDLTLLKIGVKARTMGRDQRRASHLIFVVDASASMDQPDRLGLVQQALKMLVRRLAAVDRVTLITCAGDARLHLEATSARKREKIIAAIDAIQPGGPTNLLAGLKLGYAAARRAFAPKQINHVVLCSDGVANVGQTEVQAVLNEVAADRKQGITITCVGVGYGSYNDVFLEALANQGDGSYVFLDSPGQAVRVFVEQLAATLQTVARDARIQVVFNPNRVRRYRLIGYENRDIEDNRFRDDTVDAGEVGSGQCSTALYELELTGQEAADQQEDLGTVFVRYRNAESGQIEEISSRLDSAVVRRRTVESAPGFFLAACAGRFAEILRHSEHTQDGKLTDVLHVAEQVSQALPLDRDVRELVELIRRAENLPAAP